MNGQLEWAFEKAMERKEKKLEQEIRQRTMELLRDRPPEEIMPQKRKRKVTNRAKERVPGDRIEEIRKKLGLSNGQMSLALGFATESGYQASFVDGKVLRMHELAAEGLLAKHRAGPEFTVLISLKNGQFRTAFVEDETSSLVLNGKEYLLVPKD